MERAAHDGVSKIKTTKSPALCGTKAWATPPPTNMSHKRIILADHFYIYHLLVILVSLRHFICLIDNRYTERIAWLMLNAGIHLRARSCIWSHRQ